MARSSVSPRTPGTIPVVNRTEPGATGSSPAEAQKEDDRYPCERILWDLTPEEGNVRAALREGSLPHKAFKRAILTPTAHRDFDVKPNPRVKGSGWEPREKE
jgi:hypothetical protein